MRGRGVVVFGPEGSGTRYVSRLLDAAGDAWVKHCSLPFGAEYPPLRRLMAEIDRNDVRAVLVTRRMDVLGQSQVRARHVANIGEAMVNAHRAYTWAVHECARMQVPWLLVSYEALEDLAYRLFVCHWALEDVDEDKVGESVFVDGNEKYLEAG